MKTIRTLILAGTAIAAAAVVAQTATAQPSRSHTMTVSLPDGTVETIRYTGDSAPVVAVAPDGPFAGLGSTPVFDGFGRGSRFAALERMTAAMDREAAAMLSQVDQLDQSAFGRPDGLLSVDLSRLPPGAQGYSFVSAMTGNGVCTRSVQYYSNGTGKPQVSERTSGDCAPTAATARQSLRTLGPVKARRPADGLIEASYRPAPRPATVAE